MKRFTRMVEVAVAVWIGTTASAADKSRRPENPVERGASQTRRVAACAAALDVLSVEAEKSYRAAITPPIAAVKPVPLPVENASARRALNELELALVEAPKGDPLDRAARRFAAAAEALLLRSREPARRVGERESAQTASLQALLATHELFQNAAVQLRLELQEAIRAEGLLQAMRARNPRDAD